MEKIANFEKSSTHLDALKCLYLKRYTRYVKNKHIFEIYVKFCFRLKYFLKEFKF